MKVILIKDCKDGKANTVLNVKGGYASNFLFKNNLAVPFNKENAKKLKQTLATISAQKNLIKEKNQKIAEKLKKITIKYELTTGNGIITNHSITDRHLSSDLKSKFGINVDKVHIMAKRINEIGNHKIKVDLPPNIHSYFMISIIKKHGK